MKRYFLFLAIPCVIAVAVIAHFNPMGYAATSGALAGAEVGSMDAGASATGEAAAAGAAVGGAVGTLVK